MATIRSEQRETGFSINTRNPPQLLSVDPEFDLFRLLDARETAPSIGQVFGESEITAVLPADADEAERNAYEALVAGWESPAQKINRVLDSEVTELPADQAVWLFGAGNRLVEQLFPADGIARVSRSDDALDLAGEQLSFAGTSTVAMNRHPANPGKAVGRITVGTPAAFEGMGRKLPHYGKYSYLAFTGDEPENFLKGEWTATDSPLLVDLRPDDARDTAVAVTGLPKRSAQPPRRIGTSGAGRRRRSPPTWAPCGTWSGARCGPSPTLGWCGWSGSASCCSIGRGWRPRRSADRVRLLS